MRPAQRHQQRREHERAGHRLTLAQQRVHRDQAAQPRTPRAAAANCRARPVPECLCDAGKRWQMPLQLLRPRRHVNSLDRDPGQARAQPVRTDSIRITDRPRGRRAPRCPAGATHELVAALSSPRSTSSPRNRLADHQGTNFPSRGCGSVQRAPHSRQRRTDILPTTASRLDIEVQERRAQHSHQRRGDFPRPAGGAVAISSTSAALRRTCAVPAPCAGPAARVTSKPTQTWVPAEELLLDLGPIGRRTLISRRPRFAGRNWLLEIHLQLHPGTQVSWDAKIEPQVLEEVQVTDHDPGASVGWA